MNRIGQIGHSGSSRLRVVTWTEHAWGARGVQRGEEKAAADGDDLCRQHVDFAVGAREERKSFSLFY